MTQQNDVSLNSPAPGKPRRCRTVKVSSGTGQRLTGILVRTHPKGYGFLAHPNQVDHFVRQSTVPTWAWLEGARLAFTSAPPAPGKSAPRAEEIEVLSIPGPERATDGVLAAASGTAAR